MDGLNKILAGGHECALVRGRINDGAWRAGLNVGEIDVLGRRAGLNVGENVAQNVFVGGRNFFLRIYLNCS